MEKVNKEPKIIQIIPAPPSMRAIYKSAPDIHTVVVALAMVEDEYGERTVKPLDCMEDGEITFCQGVENFCGVVFSDLSTEELDKIAAEKNDWEKFE